MPAKKIIFGLMCLLLVTVVILFCVAIGRVGTMIGALLHVGISPQTTAPATSAPPQPTEPPTAPPTSVPTDPPTQPTEPPTQPTDPTHSHQYVLAEKVDAGCDTQGYEVYVCECGKNDYRNFTDPLGHQFGPAEQILPTCDTKGCHRSVCQRCGSVNEWDVVEPLGHAPELVETVIPTCTEAGYDLYHCANCGLETKENETPALGHDQTLIDSIQPPTCTEPGVTVYWCTLCGAINPVETPALGHSYGQWLPNEDGTMYRVCANCGETESSAAFRITRENISTSSSGAKLYSIHVGTDEEPEMFHFAIWDYINDGTLTYTLDTVRGLVVNYTDSTGTPVEVTRYFGDNIAIVIKPAEETP